ncbi:orotidine-5'-phosphate decarboxylase [Candidatus Borkfalkia ceftriaxoniphila]|uniref:Orotidine 5'-phosphate decarboxylase n=1 Tax=Candidatus Borkfalkia ceftriaxoniphila TaxID=2508949 RepID=A0A4Q2K861_9FIRM|nr:orotidine-5'-phosphate decarboxylase [Candidatus Borkfalkia ceftriaxoniphila]RXZ58221.1 orotidine-5'-phosphate decarboxylase [Candidatus Borkfalkia ceftriaxoniphila]
MIDRLIEKIKQTDNPSVVGLDTNFDYLPDELRAGVADLRGAAQAIAEFNRNVIDNICDIVPAVKVQIAYYEMYGVEGMKTFAETLAYASKKGMYVMTDAKRNDIGATAECYAKAYLGKTFVNGASETAFDSDFLTVNGYLGSDGIVPFLKWMKECDKGIFVLVKTSNPSSGELQDMRLSDGKTVYEYMGQWVEAWGKNCRGKYGYSDVGAVVGATHPAQAEILRKQMPHTFFLIPGYGAQGGTARDLKVCFDADGMGGIVNSSRGILCAYRQEKYNGKSYSEAARLASIDMKNDLNQAIKG